MKLIAICTSMIPFSMVNYVDTALTSYARKFPALHSKEIYFDNDKRRYSIGDRTRRDVDSMAAQLEDANSKCNTDKEKIKHCIRVRVVCGEKVDLYSDGQLVINPQDYVADGNSTDVPTLERRSNMSNIDQRVSKAVQKIKAVQNHIQSRSMENFHLGDHPLKKAVAVVGSTAPYEVTIKNALAKCSAIRIRWWKYHCHPCLDTNGEILG